jgi:hypothetical protein
MLVQPLGWTDEFRRLGVGLGAAVGARRVLQGGGVAEENHRAGFEGQLRSWFFPSQSARISVAGEIPSSLQLARISTEPRAAGKVGTSS